ncbi:MAG TPA: FAD-dependent oxidoreductase [Acidimicrobiales bacterium]|nr:FAD-dependent oxidoreductase [Acidimicrobiales bacterium]
MPHTQVTALIGNDRLESLELVDAEQNTTRLDVQGLFVFIGAKPSTGWLDDQLAEDEDGFLLTGTDIPLSRRDPAGRAPLFLETSRPGVFCVGDVRSGSVKRAATAIGEGSKAVRLVFDRLTTGSQR